MTLTANSPYTDVSLEKNQHVSYCLLRGFCAITMGAASEPFWPTKLKDLFPGFPEMFTSPCSMPGYLRNRHRARRLQAQARGKWAPTHRCGLEARSGAKGSQHTEGTGRAKTRTWPQRKARTNPTQLQS